MARPFFWPPTCRSSHLARVPVAANGRQVLVHEELAPASARAPRASPRPSPLGAMASGAASPNPSITAASAFTIMTARCVRLGGVLRDQRRRAGRRAAPARGRAPCAERPDGVVSPPKSSRAIRYETAGSDASRCVARSSTPRAAANGAICEPTASRCRSCAAPRPSDGRPPGASRGARPGGLLLTRSRRARGAFARRRPFAPPSALADAERVARRRACSCAAFERGVGRPFFKQRRHHAERVVDAEILLVAPGSRLRNSVECVRLRRDPLAPRSRRGSAQTCRRCSSSSGASTGLACPRTIQTRRSKSGRTARSVDYHDPCFERAALTAGPRLARLPRKRISRSRLLRLLELAHGLQRRLRSKSRAFAPPSARPPCARRFAVPPPAWRASLAAIVAPRPAAGARALAVGFLRRRHRLQRRGRREMSFDAGSFGGAGFAHGRRIFGCCCCCCCRICAPPTASLLHRRLVKAGGCWRAISPSAAAPTAAAQPMREGSRATGPSCPG